MPQCRNCKEFKDQDEFPWREQSRGIRATICKTCMASQSREWYATHKNRQKETVRRSRKENREKAQHFIYHYLSNQICADCGEYDYAVLTFDNVIGKKKMEVSRMDNEGYSIEAIMDEISKCEVVCANCHMRREARRRSGGRFRKFWPKLPWEK